MSNKKEPVICYFHFMYNAWSEKKAKEVFAEIFDDWKYLWRKWVSYRDEYGVDAAITKFFVDGLDSELQHKISTAAYEYYNGK